MDLWRVFLRNKTRMHLWSAMDLWGAAHAVDLWRVLFTTRHAWTYADASTYGEHYSQHDKEIALNL
eukprot:326653-Rhodomonas_salina.1